MEGWMNKKELAAYIGVKSVRTVDRWIGKNHLPKGKQFPTGPHWKKDIVDKWLDGFGQYEQQCNRQFKHLQALQEKSPRPLCRFGAFFISMYGGMYGVFHQSPENACESKYTWRKRWDSNPRRVAPRWFSRPVHSTTLPHFRRQISFAFYRSNEKKSTGIACSGKSGKNVLSARLDAPKRACRRDWACPRALRADSLRT